MFNINDEMIRDKYYYDHRKIKGCKIVNMLHQCCATLILVFILYLYCMKNF